MSATQDKKTPATDAPAPTVSPLPPLFRPHNAPAIVARELRIAFSVYGEMARRGEVDLFPDDLPPAFVHEHLQAHLAEELAHTGATQAQAEAIKARDEIAAKARKLRQRVMDALDGTYPAGNPSRGKFFPPGQADHAESQYLIALGKGMEQHPLRSLLPAITAADVLGVGRALANAEEAVQVARSNKEASSRTRENLEPTTASIASRLTYLVRSRYGRTSKQLAAYGLTVQTAPRGRRPAKAKGKAEETPAQGEPTAD